MYPVILPIEQRELSSSLFSFLATVTVQSSVSDALSVMVVSQNIWVERVDKERRMHAARPV